jgi:hypothetical protein
MASAGSVRREKLHFRQSFGVTGHEEHLNFRLEFNDLAVEVGPAQSRHKHIGYQEIDSSRMLLGQRRAHPEKRTRREQCSQTRGEIYRWRGQAPIHRPPAALLRPQLTNRR